MKNKNTMYIVQGAVIAALYAVLTVMQNILLPGSASMAVQFRASEALTVLALFTPAAVPGLSIGCIIANLSSVASLGIYDLLFGSAASFFAALTMYALRNVRIFKIPFWAFLMPAVMGFEIDFFFVNSLHFNFADFLLQGGLVALGELGVLFILGLPLFLVIEKKKLQATLHLDSKE